MTTELPPPSQATSDTANDHNPLAALTPAQKTAAITRVSCLEHDIFDDGGHIRRGLPRSAVEQSVETINELRRGLGWLEINLDGRWRWPS
jgi:hypothetical protein